MVSKYLLGMLWIQKEKQMFLSERQGASRITVSRQRVCEAEFSEEREAVKSFWNLMHAHQWTGLALVTAITSITSGFTRLGL